MSISVDSKRKSPLITGGIFSPKNTRKSKSREESSVTELMHDYSDVLKTLRDVFTQTVNAAFPDANFLVKEKVPGSNIEKDTRLSFVMRAASSDLSDMILKPELVKNYQQTLKKHLDTIQRQADKQAEYSELLNIKKTYQALSKAATKLKELRKEASRLTSHGLTFKSDC